jgi:hypothetical protein
MCLIIFPLLDHVLPNFLLIHEKFCLHECILIFDPFQLNSLVESVIFFLGFLGKQSNLLLQVLQLLLSDGGMAWQLQDILLKVLDGFGKLLLIVRLGAHLCFKLAIFLSKVFGSIRCDFEPTHIHCNSQFQGFLVHLLF